MDATASVHFFTTLSLRQPWAALIAHRIKSIEIRSWSTSYRGPILIHASRQPDKREEGWRLVKGKARFTSTIVGGVIATAELSDCIQYATKKQFEADESLHRNPVEWFKGPETFGFVLRRVRIVPFHGVPGCGRFFQVKYDPKLLVKQ